ncbi:MAG: 3-hydroxyacyl-CoA dehydrogenase [Gammaproteobacteria bacterium]|nr:3-hydroxyacyl-CoA dehydrogenase [Gammaproteobacteria bacterium]MBY0544956.1 3-hydroxyacyl-CoA dehydrogenase [Gammaproteobacteria bacterium]
MQIKGTIAVVTGGASGMGAATARFLAQKGAKVAVLDVNEAQLMAIAKEISGIAIVCDVTRADSGLAAFEQIEAKLGRPSILVNCAGICPAQRVVGKEGPMSLDVFTRVIEVNLIGTFNMLRLAAASMSLREPLNETGERGIIINTASVAAYEGQIGQAAYSASKGGIVSMTLPLARELARFGIRVMTIAPGIMQTPMLGAMPQAVQESLAEQVPFPKRLGRPEEYAQLVGHIIDNEMLNGEVIRLDGAIRMQAK